jgi:hypothetical protein
MLFIKFTENTRRPKCPELGPTEAETRTDPTRREVSAQPSETKRRQPSQCCLSHCPATNSLHGRVSRRDTRRSSVAAITDPRLPQPERTMSLALRVTRLGGRKEFVHFVHHRRVERFLLTHARIRHHAQVLPCLQRVGVGYVEVEVTELLLWHA